MKRILFLLTLSLIFVSCTKKECYECNTVHSVKVYHKQNTIIAEISSRSEEFCGTDSEVEDYINSNSKVTRYTIEATTCR